MDDDDLVSSDSDQFLDEDELEKKKKIWKVLDFDGQLTNKKYIDEERVEEILRPLIKKVYAELSHYKDTTTERIDIVNINLQKEYHLENLSNLKHPAISFDSRPWLTSSEPS